MQPEDRVRLQYMLDAAQEALDFARGHNRDDLQQDRMLLLALVKCIEIIGEAAGKVSAEARADAPDIPWVGLHRPRFSPLLKAFLFWKVGLEYTSIRR
jgi:uncharacterized protein with HEPN domain